MMIRIAHLYYDLANLYGERGNVAVMTHYLQDQGVDVQVDKLTIGDAVDWQSYDFLYMGAMTETNQVLVYDDLKQYKAPLMEYLKQGKCMLVTGTSLELFGKKWYDGKQDREGLCIGDFSVKPLEKRYMKEIIVKHETFGEVVGFQNQAHGIVNNSTPWFSSIVQGMGSYPGETAEGVQFGQFYATYIIGPLLARNPAVADYFVRVLLEAKGLAMKTGSKRHELDQKAYESYKEMIKNS